MQVKADENIVIKQVLKNNGAVRFVEYFSNTDSRNHIISAERFCELFGFSMEELEQEQK